MAVCPVSRDFDLFGALYQGDPAASLREARATMPVFYSTVHASYVVTRHEDIRCVYTHPDHFVSSIRAEPHLPLCPRAREKLSEYGYTRSQTLGSDDSPQHMERRKKLTPPLSPANLSLFEPRVRRVHTSYIDAFVQRGEADLVADLFFDAAAAVALEFMGVPASDAPRAKHFSDGVIAFGYGRMTEDEQVAICEVIGRNKLYSMELIQQLMEDPDGPGWLQLAVRLHAEDPELINQEFLSGLAMVTLAAAHETTSSAAGNAMLLLLRNRESWNALCGDSSLIPNAVEECLRLGGSFVTERRLCVKELAVGGLTIPEGAKVVLALGSGNADEAMFAEAERFDIRRSNARRHLTFGLGTHQCLGAPLARLQLRTFLEELTRRLPHMRLVAERAIEYPVSAGTRGPRSVPIEWDPRENPLEGDRASVSAVMATELGPST